MVLELFKFGKSKQMEYLNIVQKIGNIANRSDINKETSLSKIHKVISSNKKKGVKREICFLKRLHNSGVRVLSQMLLQRHVTRKVQNVTMNLVHVQCLN